MVVAMVVVSARLMISGWWSTIHGAGHVGRGRRPSWFTTSADFMAKVSLDRVTGSSVELSDMLIPAIAPVMVMIRPRPRSLGGQLEQVAMDQQQHLEPGLTTQPHGAGQHLDAMAIPVTGALLGVNENRWFRVRSA